MEEETEEEDGERTVEDGTANNERLAGKAEEKAEEESKEKAKEGAVEEANGEAKEKMEDEAVEGAVKYGAANNERLI